MSSVNDDVKQEAQNLEARYRTLAEAITQIIWVSRADGEVTQVSDAWTAITGHPKEVALGRRFLGLIPPEDVAAFADRWAAALATNQSFEAEFRLRHADGHYLHMRSRSVPVWAGDRILERIGTLTDVTATRVAEEARRMSEKRFETAFDASPTPMAIRDTATQCLLAANQAYLDLTGFTLADLMANDLGAIDHWRGQPERVAALVEEFKNTRRLRDVQAQIRRKSGELRTVVFRAEGVEIDGRACSLSTLTDITERVRAEAAVQASEDMFAQAFNLSPIAMTIRDTTDGNRLLRANQAYLELTGYSAEELVGTLPDEIKLYVDRPRLVAELGKMFRGGSRVRDFQTQLRRKSGEIATVLIRAEVITIGGRACALSTIADVTEQITSRQALAESEDRFRRLSEAAWEGIALADEGLLVDANPQLAVILGYEPEEIIGRPISDFIAPGSLPIVLDHHRRGSVEPYEHQAVRKDGSIVMVEGRGRVVMHNGRPIRMTALRDVSERKRAENSRRALVAGTAAVLGAEFFPSLVRHLAAALDVKSAWVAELVAPENTRIRALSWWTNGGYAEPFEWALAGTPSEAVMADGMRLYDDAPAMFPDDGILASLGIVGYAGVALFDTNRVPLGLLAVADDKPLALSDDLLSMLSVFGARAGVELERIRAEAEVRRLNADLERRVADRTGELEAANRELESFSYSVSHDLRAPLRHIGGFVELLQREAGSTLSDSAREHLGEISGAARRMGTLIDDLLEFSRVGRAGLHLIDLDLNALVREVIEQLTRECPDRRIDWRAGPLPSVHGDRNLLWQVFYNLLANAVKYTRPRDIARIEITALPATTPNQIVYAVRDNGVGFDPRYTHKLFGVFQRLHAASAFEGTGIGLANVQRIVQRHGGRVWAEGQVEAGATFYLSLPEAASIVAAASTTGAA